APTLQIQRLHANLYDGQLDATTRLDTLTRELKASAHTTFDVQKITPLLTTNTQIWLSDFSCQKPPNAEAQLPMILPAWTNGHPDWSREVRPTLQLDGRFHVIDGAYCGVPISSAQSSFTFSNLAWHLPDLRVERPEGTLELSHVADKR